MGGGHASGTRRRGTTEFPATWSDRRIIEAVRDVANDPDETPRRQRNGRWRATGERFGVGMVVLVEDDGLVHTAYPVRGEGVVRNPDTANDPANPTVADLVDGRVSYFAESLLDQLSGRLPEQELRDYRGLLWSGEWEELVDVLAAHLVVDRVQLSVDEFADFERLINTYDVPMPGHAFISDREHVLEQLRP